MESKSLGLALHGETRTVRPKQVWVASIMESAAEEADASRFADAVDTGREQATTYTKGKAVAGNWRVRCAAATTGRSSGQ